MGLNKARHSKSAGFPRWAIVVLSSVAVAAFTVTGVVLTLSHLRRKAVDTGAPVSYSSVAYEPSEVTLPTETVTQTQTEPSTTTTTTVTTTKRTTIPSVKPPAVVVEQKNSEGDKLAQVKAAEVAQQQEVAHPQTIIDGSVPGRVTLSDLKKLYGVSDHLIGLDIWRGTGNENIDWNAVKNAGIDFVMVRCGYRTTVSGVIYKDAGFERNMNGALNAGIPVGVYFYSAAKNKEEALEEAAFVLEVIAPYKSRITWPVAFDYECFSDRLFGITKAKATEACKAFMDYIAQYDYTPILYSFRNAFRDNLDTKVLSDYWVWFAQYTELRYKTSIYDHEIWQCASDGLVPGIDTWADLNIAYRDFGKPHEKTRKEQQEADRKAEEEKDVSVIPVPPQEEGLPEGDTGENSGEEGDSSSEIPIFKPAEKNE